MRAVQITRFGGPEVLDVVDLPDPTPGPGQQLYEVSSAGVNFADTHQTENSYLSAQERPSSRAPSSSVTRQTASGSSGWLRAVGMPRRWSPSRS